jgi:soluble lytic murein transglycosylase
MQRLYSTLLIIFILFACISNAAIAATIEQQRKQYQQAKKALRDGKITHFLQLSETIREYPLYPYLRYNYLYPRLHKVKPDEIEEFLNQFPDFSLTESLRTKWLKHLARTQQWQTYTNNYTPQDDTSLQCNHLIARIKSNNSTLLLEDIRSVWLAGISLPSECDPAFNLLYKSDLMTNELVWQRIQFAMERSNTGLANYLGKYLDGYYKQWAINWIAVHNNPDKYTRDPAFDDAVLARQILIHGINRLSRININKAIDNWDILQKRYSFTPGERADIDKVIAVRAARKKHSRSIELMDKINPFNVDEEVFQWRLVTALKSNNWNKLHQWTDGVPAYEDLKYRWFYWHARALEQTGEQEKAGRIYTSIANKRDYYGFLASDRQGIDYNMEHKPLPNNTEEKEKIRNLPGIKRAEELRAINETYMARREWNHTLRFMTSYQKEIAALIAADLGWHDVAIISLGSAHSYDDLEVRFPIPYESLILENARKRQLDPGWMYALVRSESAFIEDVKSPAGALGLMQVMPQTGRETARSMGLKNFKTAYLLEAEKNVPIGSTYLRQMLDKFGGNMILATAAYNAGPHRVKSWLPKSGCIDADIWVELIPFDETRTYVRRVMFFASIYDWRLQKQVMPLRQRMAAVTPNSNNVVAGLACSSQEVSYN